MTTPRKPTKPEMERALTEIRKHVASAEEVMNRDHGRRLGRADGLRAESDSDAWAFDFGSLETHVKFIHETLDVLADRER